MNGEKISTQSCLEEKVERSEAKARPWKSKRQRVATVVWVEGQKCLSIPLTKGQNAIIDAVDSWLEKYNWTVTGCGTTKAPFYAVTGMWVEGRKRQIRMHRMILNACSGIFGDHRNGNTLDNRRSNLRMATKVLSNVNRATRKGSSRFKGVHWDKDLSKWRARCGIACSRYKNLGSFKDEVEAAKAYDAAAFATWGEFAKLNFPLQSTASEPGIPKQAQLL